MKVNFMLLAGGMSQSVEQWSMSNDGMREVVGKVEVAQRRQVFLVRLR